MKFSLILCTLNRSEQIRYCLKSLREQTYRDFEVIVIDQSDDDLTKHYIENVLDILIKYHHIDFKGLSKARNEALKYVEGEYICLIDDDAYYASDYLQQADKLVETNKHTVFSGYIWDTIREAPFARYVDRKNGKKLSVQEVLKTCPSAGLIIPQKMIISIGNFDEKMGIGAPYGSGEETDLLFRGICKGYQVIYSKDLRLKHPYPPLKCEYIDQVKATQKIRSYYKGLGALFRKYIFKPKLIVLVVCYVEVWIKLFLKSCLIFKFDEWSTREQISGFYEGFFCYEEMS